MSPEGTEDDYDPADDEGRLHGHPRSRDPGAGHMSAQASTTRRADQVRSAPGVTVRGESCTGPGDPES